MEYLNGEIVIWGGEQQVRSGSYRPLPLHVIYFYNFKANTWRKVPAFGNVPMQSVACASVVHRGLIYIFGGYKRGNSTYTNSIYSLDTTTGTFRVLPVKGRRPSWRAWHKGWTYQEKLYFFGGNDGGLRTSDHFQPPESKYNRDNLLVSFDPRTNVFTPITTVGPRPSPRSSYAMGVVNNRVFIEGGQPRDGYSLNDLYELNMMNMTWKSLGSNGRYVFGHSLTRISPNLFLIVGGYNEIWSYDFNRFGWSKNLPLPSAAFGDYLRHHSAVAVKTEKGISVVCLGGRAAKYYVSNKMFVLDII